MNDKQSRSLLDWFRSFKIGKLLNVNIGGMTSGAGLATEATLQDVKTAVENIDVSIDNIELDADTINLSTDNLETLIVASNLALTNLNTLLGTSNTNTGNSATSLSILDDWDESDRCKTNPIVGQAGVQGNTGVVTATTQRVTLATDIALPTGSNTIGNVNISSFPSGTETPSSSSVTISTGTVAAGKLSVTFTTDSSFTGTILGVARAASTTYSFSVSTPGRTLAAIAYQVTAGNMIIDIIE